MSHVAPKGRKHLSADALFRLVYSGFDNIPDYRPPDADIALTDALMSAFAMFSLKAPSLLAFDFTTGQFSTSKWLDGKRQEWACLH
jgi:hypothetical protein